MIDKIIFYISSLKPFKLIFLVTLFVLSGSIPLVYASACIADVDYTIFLFSISVVLPLLLTPLTIYILIRLTTKLHYFKVHLEDEIEKNKAKDIMLFEQARFALMGEMLANISHQWKQPLNTINLSLINMKFSGEKTVKENEYFEIIESNVNYLADTIDDFMSFFDKKSSSENKSLQLIIDEIESIVKVNMQSNNITLDISMDEQCSRVKIASSIAQVIINIINNAKDALTETKDKKIKVQCQSNSFGLKFICSDNGSGVSEALREKIFDPYFTTKEKTQGTGIGLYMSKQIILKIFDGTLSFMPPKDPEFSSSFIIRVPYSQKCVKKEIVL